VFVCIVAVLARLFYREYKRELSASPGKEIHLICDNYATHKHERGKAWQQRHPRFHCHFTPTSASWLNMVERFFRELTVNRLRRAVFRSVGELTRAIEDSVALHNQDSMPIIWTATATDLLENVKRGRAKLLNSI
jgi:hypothetical protein